MLEVTAHVELDEPANGERGAAIRRGDRWPPAGHADLDPLGPGSRRGSGSGRRSLCRLSLRGRGPQRVLPRSFYGLASLAKLVLCALRLAARLAELLLRLPELALEVLQLALKPANLPLDCFNPVERRALCGSRDGYDGGTERNQHATVATAGPTVIWHVRHSRWEEGAYHLGTRDFLQ